VIYFIFIYRSPKVDLNVTVGWMDGRVWDSDLPVVNEIEDIVGIELLNENGGITLWTPSKGSPVTNNQDDGERVAVDGIPPSPGKIRIDPYLNEDSWRNNPTNPIGDTQPDSCLLSDSTKIKSIPLRPYPYNRYPSQWQPCKELLSRFAAL
jgi:hypothetical protein